MSSEGKIISNGTPGMVTGIQSQSKIFKILMVVCMIVSVFILIGVAINLFNYGTSSSSKPTSKEGKTPKKNDIHILPGLFKEDNVITLYSTKKIETNKKTEKDKCENINNNIDSISKKYMANGKISSPSDYENYTNKMGVEINKCNGMKECKLNPSAIIINKCSKLTTTTTTKKSDITTTTANSIDTFLNDVKSDPGSVDSGKVVNNLRSNISNTTTTPLKEGFLSGMSDMSSGIESSIDPNKSSDESNNSSKSENSHKKKDIEAYKCQSDFFYSFISHVDKPDEKSIKNGDQISASLCNGSCTLDNNSFNLNYGKISDSNNNINTYADTNYLYYTNQQSDLNKTQKNTIYKNYSLPIINDTMSKIENYKICLHNSESEKEKDDDDNSGFSILFG